MTVTLPSTKARQQFFKLLELVEQPGFAVTITVEGIPKAVMMPVEDFEGFMETLEISSDKKLFNRLKKALKGFQKERFLSEKEVKKALKL